MQIAQHLTPELVLQPRFMKHPNGARLVTESIVCASNPEQYAKKYSRYTGYDYKSANGHFEVSFGDKSHVTVVSPEQVGSVVPGSAAPAVPSLVGFTVAVADLSRVCTLLEGKSIPFQEYKGRLIVSAADGCGSAVLFEA